MKSRFFILFTGASALMISGFAQATVPYPEIETLRRQTIVARVAVDRPKSPKVAQCKIKINAVTLGSKLALAQEGTSKQWSTLTVGTEDLHNLDGKVQECLSRASCQIYDTFLKTAKAAPTVQQEVEILKESLNKKLVKMTTQHYLKALDGIPKPCEILRQLNK